MSGFTSLAKKQIFLAGVVCSLIVLVPLNAAFTLARMQGNPAYGVDFQFNSPTMFAVYILGAVANALVLLKFLLPGWRSHRKWLGWLLGTSLLLGPFAFALLLPPLQSFLYGVDVIAEQFPIADYPPNAIILLIAVRASIWLAAVLFSPNFYLLCGLSRKKRTEKVAGIFAAIGLVPLLIGFVSIGQGNGFIFLTLLSLLIQAGYIIIYFNWPVLTRPILEKSEKEIINMNGITFERNPAPKQKPDQTKLGFGNYFTDHMFLMNYDEGQGWHDPRIVPYGPISLEPSAMCLHYGQEVFEGMKAYYGADGKIRLFRPQENMARLNLSNDRLCIPLVDETFAVHAIEELIQADKDWIPTLDGTSLYIRPFIFAVDPFVGVRPAKQLIFCIILSPVGAYYPEGLNPVKIFVEEEYVRAIRGGTGFAKAGGNYAGTLKAQGLAQAQGFTQVLWLDGVERKYIEEVGTMNVFFAFENEIVTPALQGSILGGITRKSCIEILRGWGYTVNERPLAIDEVVAAAKSGGLKEAFGSGTAAVVSPIGSLTCGGETLAVNNGEIGGLTQRLYDELTGIQWGKVEDTYGWTKVIA